MQVIKSFSLFPTDHTNWLGYLLKLFAAIKCNRKGYKIKRHYTIMAHEGASLSISRSAVFDSANPWTVAHQVPLSLEFFRQEYWSRLPFPSPGNLPHPGIEPGSPAMQMDSVPSDPPEKLLEFKVLHKWWCVYHTYSHVLYIYYITTYTMIYIYIYILSCWLCAQSCLTLCNPMDCSLPGSSIHGIFQARILEWVAISFCRGSTRPKDRTHLSCVSCLDRQILYHYTTWEVHMNTISHLYCILHILYVHTMYILYIQVFHWIVNWSFKVMYETHQS